MKRNMFLKRGLSLIMALVLAIGMFTIFIPVYAMDPSVINVRATVRGTSF